LKKKIKNYDENPILILTQFRNLEYIKVLSKKRIFILKKQDFHFLGIF